MNNSWHLTKIGKKAFPEGIKLAAVATLETGSTPVGRLAVFTIDDDGKLWANLGSGEAGSGGNGSIAWKKWQAVGAGFTPLNTPTAAIFEEQLFIFARRAKRGELVYFQMPIAGQIPEKTRGWKTFGRGEKAFIIPPDERIQVVPIVQSIGYKVMDLIVRDGKRQLYRNRWKEDRWLGFEVLSDEVYDSPVLATATYEEVQLIHRNSEGAIRHASYLAPLDW